MISEIRVSTIGVSDLAKSADFYKAVFDYAVHGEGPIDPGATTELWGGAADLKGTQLLMAPEGATSGYIRLVQFESPGELYWGDYSNREDYGHYAVNIRVPQIDDVVARISTHGGKVRSGPTQWTVMDDLSAWDSMSFDPDGILLDVFELTPGSSNPLAEFDGRPSPLQTIALHSSDARRSALFYAALGMRPLYDKLICGMEEFFNLPEGTDLLNINMMNPQSPVIGRVEIAQYVGFPGRSQRETAIAGALGILSIAMETKDLDATEKLLAAIGAEPAGDRIQFRDSSFGSTQARAYFGPDDERLEFYQLG